MNSKLRACVIVWKLIAILVSIPILTAAFLGVLVAIANTFRYEEFCYVRYPSNNFHRVGYCLVPNGFIIFSIPIIVYMFLLLCYVNCRVGQLNRENVTVVLTLCMIGFGLMVFGSLVWYCISGVVGFIQLNQLGSAAGYWTGVIVTGIIMLWFCTWMCIRGEEEPEVEKDEYVEMKV